MRMFIVPPRDADSSSCVTRSGTETLLPAHAGGAAQRSKMARVMTATKSRRRAFGQIRDGSAALPQCSLEHFACGPYAHPTAPHIGCLISTVR